MGASALFDCRDVTGHSYAELVALCEQARVLAGQDVTEEQEKAARQLVEAYAALIDARIMVPGEIRKAVADCVFTGHTRERN
jgi:hypothetical protein